MDSVSAAVCPRTRRGTRGGRSKTKWLLTKWPLCPPTQSSSDMSMCQCVFVCILPSSCCSSVHVLFFRGVLGVTTRDPGLTGRPKMPRGFALALADLFVINRPYTLYVYCEAVQKLAHATRAPKRRFAATSWCFGQCLICADVLRCAGLERQASSSIALPLPVLFEKEDDDRVVYWKRK